METTTQTAAKRFSVIVPSLQQAQFLERTLQSILSQDYPALEVIVQDGGSTDGSVAILQRYQDRIQWSNQPDCGQAAAINAGRRRASGDFLCYLNSDDVLYPEALRKVANYFAAHPETDIVYGLADYIDEDDRLVAEYPVEPWNYSRLLETCFICQPACFWRRSVMERFAGFDESLRYVMDYDYWLRIGAKCQFGFLEEKLAGSRCHSAAKSFATATAAQQEGMKLLQRYHGGRIPVRWLIAYARHCAERRLAVNNNSKWQLMQFAVIYWWHLFRLLPQMKHGGWQTLQHKLLPPYPSAQFRRNDPIDALRRDLSSKFKCHK